MGSVTENVIREGKTFCLIIFLVGFNLPCNRMSRPKQVPENTLYTKLTAQISFTHSLSISLGKSSRKYPVSVQS